MINSPTSFPAPSQILALPSLSKQNLPWKYVDQNLDSLLDCPPFLTPDLSADLVCSSFATNSRPNHSCHFLSSVSSGLSHVEVSLLLWLGLFSTRAESPLVAALLIGKVAPAPGNTQTGNHFLTLLPLLRVLLPPWLLLEHCQARFHSSIPALGTLCLLL